MALRLPAPWRGLLVAAALILSGTALLQATAYPDLTRTLRAAGLSRVLTSTLEGLWLMFPVHLLFIAAFLTLAAVRVRIPADSGLLVSALILAADTALLGGFMGMFSGTVLVGVSTGLVIIARLIRQAMLAGTA
jgi:hypothetical protein